MPFALIIVGAAFLVAGVRNTQSTLFGLVRAEFTGPNNFIFWVISILIIGAVGYIPKLKALSDGFLALVILVLILTRGNPNAVGGGFFQQFTRQIGTTTTAPAPTGVTSAQANQSLFGTLGTLPQLPSLPTTH